MRILMLLSSAALCAGAVTAPAAAQNWGGSWPGSSFQDGRGDRHDDSRRDMPDHHRHHRGAFFGGPWASDTWALYNNRSWDPNSYNDWWHDRPDRAYPRWVQHNQNCTEDRMWWSGSGWHC